MIKKRIKMESERDLVKEAVIDYWGDRCGEYEEGCGCCEAWKQFDKLNLEAKE